jgi:enoyl-CoA hydratase
MEMIMTAGMVTADENIEPLVTTWCATGQTNSVMEWHKKWETLLWRSAKLSSINANYKDGENGFETEIKSFGKCFGTVDFKEGTAAF